MQPVSRLWYAGTMEAGFLSPAGEEPEFVDESAAVELVDLAQSPDEGGDVEHPPPSARSEEAEAMADGLLSDEARYARWQGRKPPVAHLKDGLVWPPGHPGPVPLFDVGDRVVVEQRASFLDARPDPLCPDRTVRHPWLRTMVGRVVDIDDDTGLVRCVDEASDARWPREFFASMTSGHCAFYLPPRVGNPFDVSAVIAAQRAADRAAREAADQVARAAGTKRGRGRPPGAKNRPKDVIKAEREAIRRAREEKVALRQARRAGR